MSQSQRSEAWRTLLRELRRAPRALLRDRVFTAMVFVTLTLGLGATTAIFTVLDAVVLRALPYRDPGALVSVMHPATVPGSGERIWGLSPGSYFGFRNGATRISDMGLYATSGFTVTNDGEAELVQTVRTSASLFTTLRALPFAGRLLLPDDDVPGGPAVAVLSHEFFERRFGGDRAVIGRTLETSGGPFEIVGVAEPGLTLPMPGPFASTSNLAGFAVDVWTPLQLDPAGPFYNNHPYVGVARLLPGVSVADAQQEFAALFTRITADLPNVYSPGFLTQYNFRVQVSALRDAVLGTTVPRALWMLFGSVLLVMLIAAANVGNLFLLRFASRRRESAVRSALGASRTDMAAHYLAETLLLCLGAALASIVVSVVALRALLVIAPTNIPRLATVALTGRSVLVALGLALMLALMLGLAPLLRRGIDMGTLRDGGRGLSASPRQRAVRHTLVVGQLALTLVLLAGAGLLLRSFRELRQVQPGFDAADVLAFDLSLPFLTYDTREKAATFHQTLQGLLAEIPGVTAVGGGPVPLEAFGTGCSVVFRENRPFGVDEQTPCVSTPIALPGYFDVLGMQVEGRTPEWRDVTSRSQAVVVTRSLATRLWPGESAIGKGIASNGSDSESWYRVVGVVADVRAESLDLPPTEAVFYAATGLRADVRSGDLNDITYLLRADVADLYTLVPAIRRAVASLDPQVPLVSPRAMQRVVSQSMAQTTFLLTLLALAAGGALLLSAVGVYGVIAHLVAQRRSELGIRLALGATPSQVVRLVVMQSVRLAAVGIGLGLLAALASARVLAALVYGVRETDLTVLVAGTMLMLVVVLVASWLPARGASRIEPGEAMRLH